jgi:protease IV
MHAGGDALASDLMWREIGKLAKEKPLVATMGDVAASGGYYMSMAAPLVLAHPLTITGSIGVVTGKFSLEELYNKVRTRIVVGISCCGV